MDLDGDQPRLDDQGNQQRIDLRRDWASAGRMTCSPGRCGGVVSAMMLSLNYDGLNPTGPPGRVLRDHRQHSGRQHRPQGSRQVRPAERPPPDRLTAWLDGLADGSVFDVDPRIWDDQIPGTPVLQHFTDWGGIIPA